MKKEKIGLTAKFFGRLPLNNKERKEWEKSIKERRQSIEKEFSKRKVKVGNFP